MPCPVVVHVRRSDRTVGSPFRARRRSSRRRCRGRSGSAFHPPLQIPCAAPVPSAKLRASKRSGTGARNGRSPGAPIRYDSVPCRRIASERSAAGSRVRSHTSVAPGGWSSCPPPVSTVVGVAEVPRAICAVVRSLTHGTWADHDGCGGRPLWFRRTVHTELAVVRPSRSMRALDEHRPQRLVPPPSAPRRALAGTLASPRHTPAQAANGADGAEQSV